MDRPQDFEDDGRTIADMSGVDRRTPLGYIRAGRSLFSRRDPSPAGSGSDRPWEDRSVSRRERRAVMGAALAAALVVTGVFGAAFAAVIWLILKVGGM